MLFFLFVDFSDKSVVYGPIYEIVQGNGIPFEKVLE